MRYPGTLSLLFLVGMTGCVEPLDTTRQPVDEGTFGETVYTLTCKRVGYLADLADGDGIVDVRGDRYRDVCRHGVEPGEGAHAEVRALHERRPGLIPAIDRAFPAPFLPDLQAYLTSHGFLRLFDDGTAEDAVGLVAGLLRHLADDDEVPAALARLDRRGGYRPVEAALGALRAVVEYEDLDAFLDVVLGAIGPGGPARGELGRLQLALARELLDAAPLEDAAAPDRSLALALDLLLTEVPALGTGRPMPLARRDARGLALVAADPDTGALPSPFVDEDEDGLADADDRGRWLGAGGVPVAGPSPFPDPFAAVDRAAARDLLGRALAAPDGPAVFVTVDLDRTVLAALARDATHLLDPERGAALDLLRGASALLGPRQTTTRAYRDGSTIEYRGYDTAESPLLDLVHAWLGLLADPGLDDVLGLVRRLLIEHEASAARLAEAALVVADLGASYPDARLEPGASLHDDLVEVAVEILAVPGLAEEVLRALEDPATRALAGRFRDYLRHKDGLTYHPTTHAVVGGLATLVDRAQPDSGFNRSLMQRLLHLIADAEGVVLCNKQGAVIRDPVFGFPLATYDECELMRIPDLGAFYVQSIAYLKDAQGNVVHDSKGRPRPKARLPLELSAFLDAMATDDFLESESGIDGFRRHPTPEALNRVLFLQPTPPFIADILDPARCKDGDRFIDAHAGTIAAFELGGFYDQIRPLAQAFADRGQERLFVRLLAVLHSHWPSRDSLQHQRLNPSGKGFARMSDVRSYEPMLIDVLGSRDLWAAIVDEAPVANGLAAPSGRTGRQVLADAARDLLRPRPGLAGRDGRTATRTADGREVPALSPFYLLADAYRAKRDRVAATGAEGRAWERATGAVADRLLRGEKVGDAWRFRNRRFRHVAVAAIDHLRARAAAHRQAGDLEPWAREVLPARAEELLASPLFAGFADFVLSLQASPAARAALEGMLAHLVDEVRHPAAFQIAVTAIVDLLQLGLADRDLVPLLRSVGSALDPARGLLDRSLELLQSARRADDRGALAGLLRHLLAEHAPGRTALAEIVVAVAEVHRVRPFADRGEPLDEDNYRAVLRGVAAFLDEEKRGLRRFIRIVRERNVRE